MKQYQDIIKQCLSKGVVRTNRTNLKDKFIPSAVIQHDLRDGFPALTTKQLYYKQSIGEVLGFIRGYENAADFAALGCRFWFSDANENSAWLGSPYRKGADDLGKVYGATWRKRTAYKELEYGDPDFTTEEHLLDLGYDCVASSEKTRNIFYAKDIDQLKECVDKIINSPNDRRIIMHAWFPELFDEMALPPCHVLYRFIPDEQSRVLHMSMYQRSCDLLLGVPMNLFGSALLLKLVAHATGYVAGELSHFMSDVHLYENQLEQAAIQAEREPMMLPDVEIEGDSPPLLAMEWLEGVSPDDVKLLYYKHHPALARVEIAQG